MDGPALGSRAQPSSLSLGSDNEVLIDPSTVSLPERSKWWSNHRDILRNLENENAWPSSSDEDDTEHDAAASQTSNIGGMSTLGVSINKQSSRLASLETPAAERAAFLLDADVDDGMPTLDGAQEGQTVIESQHNDVVSQQQEHQRALRFSETGRESSTAPKRDSATGNDTTFRLIPKSFEHAGTNFLSNVGSLFSFGRTSSPDHALRNGQDEDQKGLRRRSLRSLSRRGTESMAEEGAHSRSRSRRTSNVRRASVGSRNPGNPAIDQTNRDATPKPLMRRTTSEGGLVLSPLSTTPSLGDDTRWENNSEMLNSRSRAIKDTLSDVNLRFPVVRGFANFSFPSPFSSSTPVTAYGVAPLLPDRAPEISSTSTLRQKEAIPKPKAVSRVSPAQNPHLANAIDHLTGDIVIMGGYRGSVLRSAKAPFRQQWIPIKAGLNIRRVNLEVGLDDEDERTEHTRIIPSGMLQHIGPVDVSRRLLKRLRASKNAQEGRLRVWDYGYDWRLSPTFLSAQLVSFLKTLPCNQPDVPDHERGATMISHSLGGLLTRHAINQDPWLVKHVVYAGTPQHCVNILGPLRNGDDVLLSSRILTAQTNFTIRTTFALLPLDGKCFYDARTKQPYDVDFFDPATYEEYKLTPVIARPIPVPTSASQNNNNNSGNSFLTNIVGTVAGKLPNPIGMRKNSTSTNSSTAAPKRHERSSSREAMAAQTASLSPTDTANSASNALSVQMNDPNHTGEHDPTTNTHATHVTLKYDEAYAYLTRTLASVKKFKQELAFNPEFEHIYPSTAVLFGKAWPTVNGCRVIGREGIKRADAYDTLSFGSGDGVVLAKAAMLPEGYETVRGGIVVSERGHIGLLSDLEAVGKCLEAVLDDGARRGRRRVRRDEKES